MDAHESEDSLEGELDDTVTSSMATLPSSEFPRRAVVENYDQEEEEEEEEGEEGLEEPGGDPPKNRQSVQKLMPEGSFYGESSSSVPLVERSFSVETLAGPDGTPYRSMSVPVVEDESSKKFETTSSRKKPIRQLPLPTFELKLERLKRVEKFDAFSEDEEPVLRKDYQPIDSQPKCPEAEVRKENILVYNVRKEGVPQFKKVPRWDMGDPYGTDLTLGSFSTYHGSTSINRLSGKITTVNCSGTVNPMSRMKSISIKSFGRHQSIRKTRSRADKARCGSLNEKFMDTTPHQRDLFNVSYEELSSKEVAVIKGLWKCITFDLWTFGVLTTINVFKIRGHITARDPKATPDVMSECKFLWPHANHVMKALESVVMSLDRPLVSTELVHEVGRKHWKLKIPITEDQKQLMINAFLYTFANHVHPRPNLGEMRTMRKFCSITMFLFADASRWDFEPSLPS